MTGPHKKHPSSGYLVIFNIKFRVIQGHLPHFIEIFQARDLIFQGYVYNIYNW